MPCCRKSDDAEQSGGKRQRQAGKDEQQADLQFGRLEMGQTSQLGKQQPKKKKPSKEQLLQDALQKQKQKGDVSAETQVLMMIFFLLMFHCMISSVQLALARAPNAKASSTAMLCTSMVKNVF